MEYNESLVMSSLLISYKYCSRTHYAWSAINYDLLWYHTGAYIIINTELFVIATIDIVCSYTYINIQVMDQGDVVQMIEIIMYIYKLGRVLWNSIELWYT